MRHIFPQRRPRAGQERQAERALRASLLSAPGADFALISPADILAAVARLFPPRKAAARTPAGRPAHVLH